MKSFLNLFNKFSFSAIAIITISILAFLTIFAFTTTASMAYNMDEITYFVQDNLFINILYLILFIIFIYFISSCLSRVRIKYLFIVSSILITLILLYLISDINLQPTWDAFRVIKAALEFGKGDYTMMYPGGYIYEYPFQIPIVLYFWTLSLIFGKNYIAFQLINILFLLGTYYFIVKSIYVISNNKRSTIIGIILITFFFPLHMYVLFLYSNIPSIFFLVAGLYYAIKYLTNYQKKNLIIAFLLTGTATLFKGTAYIGIIAIVILLFLDCLKHFLKSTIIITLLSLLIIISVPSFMNSVISSFDDQIDISNNIYTEIALVMGTSWGPRGAGWHSGWYEKFLYETYNRDISLMKEDGNKRLKDNLKNLFSDFNELNKFFSNKLGSMWVNPEFQGFWTIQANKNEQWGLGDKEAQSFLFIKYNPDNDNYGYFTGTYMLGNLNQIIRIYLNTLQNAIYLFALYWLVKSFKTLKTTNTLYLLTFIGGFLFLSIWEAKAQYSVLFFILLFPNASDGLRLFLDDIKKLTNRI